MNEYKGRDPKCRPRGCSSQFPLVCPHLHPQSPSSPMAIRGLWAPKCKSRPTPPGASSGCAGPSSSKIRTYLICTLCPDPQKVTPSPPS